MRSRSFEFPIRTTTRHGLVNVGAELARAIRDSGVTAGLACASVPHTTCALLVNEDEEGLKLDIIRLMEQVVEPLRKKAPFAHDRVDDNAAAHLTSLFFHPSVTVPVAQGKPLLGTWQTLFLAELDGPRDRTLHMMVLGE